MAFVGRTNPSLGDELNDYYKPIHFKICRVCGRGKPSRLCVLDTVEYSICPTCDLQEQFLVAKLKEELQVVAYATNEIQLTMQEDKT